MADLDIAELRKQVAYALDPNSPDSIRMAHTEQALLDAVPALLDAAEERDRLRQTVRACVRDYNTTRRADESQLGEGGLILAMAELLEARAQRDALLAALEPIVGQLELAQHSTAPAFLKGFVMNDTESGALLRAIAAAKETP